jgi:hypothetical protein
LQTCACTAYIAVVLRFDYSTLCPIQYLNPAK